MLDWDTLRLVRFRRGEPIRGIATSDRSIPLEVPGDGAHVTERIDALVERLAATLSAENLPRSGLIIALPHTLFQLDLLSLPRLNRTAFDALMDRKVGRSGASERGEQAYCYIRLNEGDHGAENREVLLARIPEGVLIRIHDALKRHGIRPSRLTVPIIGTANHIDHLDPATRKGSFLVVDVASDGALLTLFHGGKPKQLRFLRGVVSKDPERFSRILSIELDRSAAFHKEKFQGRSIEEIFLSGTAAHRIRIDTDGVPVRYLMDLLPGSPGTGESGDTVTDDARDEMASIRPVLPTMAGLLPRRGSRKASDSGGVDGEGFDFRARASRFALVASLSVLALLVALCGLISLSRDLSRKNDEAVRILETYSDHETLLESIRSEQRSWADAADYAQALEDRLEAFHETPRDVARVLTLLNRILSGVGHLQSLEYTSDREIGRREKEIRVPRRLTVTITGDFTGSGSEALLASLHACEETGLFSDIKFKSEGARREIISRRSMEETVEVELILR